MTISRLDALVADENFQVVEKGRRESKKESLEILSLIVEEFKLKPKVLENLKPLAGSVESMFSILCVLVKKDTPDNEDTMSPELCEWFARQESEMVRTFPLRIYGFKVPWYYFELLQSDPSANVRCVLADHPCIPFPILGKLRADRDLSVQKTAMANSCTPLAR